MRSTSSPTPSPADALTASVLPRPVVRLAWGAVAYTLLVILWGAFVRATGAGAGCGDHWPLCNGELIPTGAARHTLVEFTHRITSGLALPLVILVAWRVFRTSERGAAVRRVAIASVVFMVLEAALGAGLVLFEYVAYNASIARALWMAAHLANTFLLLAMMSLTAWWAGGRPIPRLRADGRTLAVGAALVGVLLLGAGGAVTALGDTLVLGGGLDPATDPVVATLVSARIYHPAMAFVALFLIGWAVWTSIPAGPATVRMGMTVVGAMVFQMALGALNVVLMAPVWMQLVHLLVSDLIWIGLVLFASDALAARDASPA